MRSNASSRWTQGRFPPNGIGFKIPMFYYYLYINITKICLVLNLVRSVEQLEKDLLFILVVVLI